ncbi:MAG: UDP-glucose 4-epimerase GalE [Rhodospirillaceae bacterium]
MKVLVVGGAGYIGSHMVLTLLEGGHEVIVLDDLSSGHEEALLGGELIAGSLEDAELLDRLLDDRKPDAVMHFASYIQVGESVAQPAKYYRNNFVNTINLLDAMVRHRVLRFIFSSTAAIFDESDEPITEDHPKNPINPYGRSKWMVEQALQDYDHAYALKSCCLRYFNAAGADPLARIGERHDPETHLIPLLLQAASGRRDSIRVFGRDYPTPDGTCIRDYIHVVDLCSAHLLALNQLMGTATSTVYNLGNGEGFSVQQVIDAVRDVTGKSLTIVESERRPGDRARLVADSTKARARLGWRPRYADLREIVRHAWQWEQKLAGMESSRAGHEHLQSHIPTAS